MCRLLPRPVSSRVSSRLPRLTPVQQTSLLTAYWRDRELRAPSPLCSDTDAACLLDAFLEPAMRESFRRSALREAGQNILAVRTRVLDDWLVRSPTSPSVRSQIVLLGAGMDTRAYRLELGAGCTVFEVDSDEAVLEAKHAALRAAGRRARAAVVSVAADLGDASSCRESLLEAGFEPRVPTRWLAEGLLEYLPAATHRSLFAMAAATGGAAGSSIAAQSLAPSFKTHCEVLGVSELPYQPLVAVEQTLASLAAAGWQAPRAERGGALAERLGRDVHEGFSLVFAEGPAARAAGGADLAQ